MAFKPYRDAASGEKFPPSGVGYVYHGDFPERYVRDKAERGWMQCHACGRDFKMWMTTYQNWELLPCELWDAILCTRCYREMV